MHMKLAFIDSMCDIGTQTDDTIGMFWHFVVFSVWFWSETVKLRPQGSLGGRKKFVHGPYPFSNKYFEAFSEWICIFCMKLFYHLI